MSWKEALFLTNDDGVEAPGLHRLIKELHGLGHPLAVLAPATEQSASGMRLSLQSELEFRERKDIIEFLELDEEGPPVYIYSLAGTPCDCAIVGINHGFENWAPLIRPQMCVSGINRGPNISIDVLHSGTISAAREAALYGLPAVAVSLGTYHHQDYSTGMVAILELIRRALAVTKSPPPNLMRPRGSKQCPWSVNQMAMENRVREAFRNGDIILNVNAPEKWDGVVETVPLGARWYHGATHSSDSKAGFIVGAASIEDEPIPNTDCTGLIEGHVVISPLATWPQSHPLSVPDMLLKSATFGGVDGYPEWLIENP
ncbi:MAG: 5'/3'-nucleotidase SurE [Candidatus Thermoplasmatota archaeon]|nr:5'/3'-nucleotidase SurE [Candidatus Thermoplasmatota archaeon]